MKNTIKKFNGLNGAEVSVKQLQELYDEAKKNNCGEVANRLSSVLGDVDLNDTVTVVINEKVKYSNSQTAIDFTDPAPLKTKPLEPKKNVVKDATKFREKVAMLNKIAASPEGATAVLRKAKTFNLTITTINDAINLIAQKIVDGEKIAIDIFEDEKNDKKAINTKINVTPTIDAKVKTYQDKLAAAQKLQIEIKSKIDQIFKADKKNGYSSDAFEKRMLLNKKRDTQTNVVRQLKNVVSALTAGGKVTSIKDKKGKTHIDIADFRNVNTDEIIFEEDTILTDKKPIYLPLVDQKVLNAKGYVFDAIKVDADSYLVHTGRFEDKEENYFVLLSLDQMVLVSDYYFTFKRAENKKESGERTLRSLESWDRLPAERKKRHYEQRAQQALYNSMPAKVKKVVPFDKWTALKWEDKEKVHKFYKRYGVKRVKSSLNSTTMYTSLHQMYERFVDPTAKHPKPRYANPKVWAYWEQYKEFMKYKMLDIKIQRADLSETRQKAIGITQKFGEQAFNNIFVHEVTHWIDNLMGKEVGRRYFSDNYEGTAGILANTFRKNMNAASNSDYINSTAECLARAIEQYAAFKVYGEESSIYYIERLGAAEAEYYHNSAEYVSKATMKNIITPLIESYLEEVRIKLIDTVAGLNAPRHKGAKKAALTECGRLKPGYKYLKGGQIIKLKQTPERTPKKKGTGSKKVKQDPTTKKAAVTPKKQLAAKKPKTPTKNKLPLIVYYPINQIETDTKRFQNRENLNQNTVNNIIDNFKETQLDPLIIWTDPKNKKTYLLAGHHRLEALKKMHRENAPVKFADKDYPTEKDAIKYARTLSNANRTLEQPFERAKIYREMMNAGETKAAIDKAAAIEGKNKSYILNLAALNDNGNVIEALQRLSETPDKQNEKAIEKIADWTGEARRKYPQLTNAHETEIFKFLSDSNASKRIKTKADFLQKIYALAGGMDFNKNTALNLNRVKYETEGEREYKKDYDAFKDNISNKLDTISMIKARFSDPSRKDYENPSKKDYSKVKEIADDKISQLNTEIKRIQKRMLELQKNKSKYTKAGMEQGALFGAKTKPGTKKPTSRKSTKKPKGLKGTQEPNPSTTEARTISGESTAPLVVGKLSKVKNISARSVVKNPLFNIPGETGKLLQAVELKTKGSVMVTLDGERGAGKTTALYKFINDFAKGDNKCLFASLEEDPDSNLATDKAEKYIEFENRKNVDTVGDFSSYDEFKNIVQNYDAIFIDSWQKLVRMIGKIRLDEDVRKKFDGKVFFIIFQQTTTGSTKGGAEIGFDGDIIIKMVKTPSFENNYAFLDKNRYTRVPIENLKYMIEQGITIDTTAGNTTNNDAVPKLKYKF